MFKNYHKIKFSEVIDLQIPSCNYFANDSSYPNKFKKFATIDELRLDVKNDLEEWNELTIGLETNSDYNRSKASETV